MDSPLLARPGAVPAQGTDAGVAAHYGDPYAEQRTLTRAAGQVDRSHRDIVRITGADRLSWLHSLTTQDLEHLQTLADDGTALWAHVEPGTAAALLAFLQSMRFLLRVDPEQVTGDFAVLTLMGPGRPATVPEGAVISMADSFGMDVVVPRDRLAEISAALEHDGAALAGLDAYEALRIAAHRPRLGLDTDHRTLPHEVGWIETAVHLTKGCYRGQETVARVHNLGHPPRRLVFLHLDGSEDRLPGHGDPVTSDGTPIGFTGSVARHFELGPIGLALIKRTAPVDAPLRAGGVPAAQEVIVPPDAGGNVSITLKRRSVLARPGD